MKLNDTRRKVSIREEPDAERNKKKKLHEKRLANKNHTRYITIVTWKKACRKINGLREFWNEHYQVKEDEIDLQ